MVEITDRKSAETWLTGKPREVQVAFAARCALRALPGIGMADPETLGDIALPVLRAILISGVAGTRPTPEIREAARSAASAADSAASAADSAADSAASESADSAAFAATSYDATRLESDTPEFLFRLPLWPAPMPESLKAAYAELLKFWDADLKVWGFWKRWYAAMLVEGPPLDWDLQEKVGLLPDEIWEEGAERIAEEIEKLGWEPETPEPDQNDEPETPEPDQEQITRQAERLVAQSGITVFLCRTTADEIDAAVRINCFPVEFETLRKMPPILRLIAELAASRERIEELEKQNADLIASLARLTKALEAAKGKSRSELFGDMVVETSAVVLTTGFWALIGATASHITGIVDVGDLLDRFGQSVGELPLHGPDESPGWPDPEIEA